MEDMNTLYDAILVGRFYSTMANSFALLALLLFLISAFGTMVLITHEPELWERAKKCVAIAWVSVATCVLASIVFAALNSRCPTIEDAKVIMTFKAGEKILTSDEFREALDKWMLRNDSNTSE